MAENPQDVPTYRAQPTQDRRVIANKEQQISHPNQIPDEILKDEFLNELMNSSLPKNYNFEIHKTIWKIQQTYARRVLLQLPEGLIRFGPVLVDVLTGYFSQNGNSNIKIITMGDLTYGACCIDDYLASSMACDLIVHYAHSCLVPINRLSAKTKYLYIFLDIKFELSHIVSSIEHNFDPAIHRLALGSTIQFVASIHEVARRLRHKGFDVTLPQSRPLSSGEVLGCTAPKLSSSVNTIVFICDGRFHLEALMIANPDVRAFRYDPYTRKLSSEAYNFDQMYNQRMAAVNKAVAAMRDGNTVGFVLGTLGRQGSEKVYDTMIERLLKHTRCKYIKVMMPEVVSDILTPISDVSFWVQVACPRLSIDWGSSSFQVPLLNTYEFAKCIKILLDSERDVVRQEERTYPMDFYAKNSNYDHTPNHTCLNNANCACHELA